jgi:hypothetical protein
VVTAFEPRFTEASAPWLAFGNAGFLSLSCGETISGVLGGLSSVLVFNLLSILVRRRWLRVPVFVAVTTMLLAPGYGGLSWMTLSRTAVVMLIVAVTLTRFGVLATVAFLYTDFIIRDFPLTTNWSAWALLSIWSDCTGSVRIRSHSIGPEATACETGRLLEPTSQWPRILT